VGGGGARRRRYAGLAVDQLVSQAAGHAAALEADEAPLVFCKREAKCRAFGDTVVECEAPLFADGTDVHVYPLKKDSSAFSWFTATPLVVHAGNYTVRDGRIRIWIRNPTAAPVVLSSGLALAHFDLDIPGRTKRLEAPLEPDLTADEILAEMRFDNSTCAEGELERSLGHAPFRPGAEWVNLLDPVAIAAARCSTDAEL
jgi:hypothetical protein